MTQTSDRAQERADGLQIGHVTIVGAGAMGAQIGMVSALAGLDVAVVDLTQEALDGARSQLRKRTERFVSSGRLTQADLDAAWDRLEFTTDRDSAAARTDLVIEAATEKLDVKRTLFAELDAVCPERTILATNSSTIPSSRLADATNRPDRVCNLHFFNPALVMRCVEVVRHPQTSDETVAAATEFVRRIDKEPVLLHKEIAGFVANRLLVALRDEALDLYDAGIASFEDIDVAAKTALGHPMGPFELMDLVGIDVAYLARMVEYERTGDDDAKPHPAIARLYEQGRYGRKTGGGWYDYEA